MYTRENIKPYISYYIDDAGSLRHADEMPPDARIVIYQCGFEPMAVAVWSYLPGVRLDASDAADVADDYLVEIGWMKPNERELDAVL